MGTSVGPGTDTDSADKYPVQLGVWTNWSRGQIMGATLTLKRGDANLLIAFIAFLIAFVATRFWRILCFCCHRAYSTSDLQDVVYHQRQAILRNASSPEHGLSLLLQLLWRGRRDKKGLRPLPAVAAAAFCIGIFTVAGGFSSRISTAINNEVLIKTANCGYIYCSNTFNPSLTVLPSSAERISNAANYAQQCYSDNSAGLFDCGRFVTQRLPSNMDINATCPFDDRMCRNRWGNLRLDTGYIDSHDHLGLNTPIHQRILWKQVLHCAPLVTTGFTSKGGPSTQNTTRYHYGYTSEGFNYAYEAESIEAQYASSSKYRKNYLNYGLDVLHSAVKDGMPYEKPSTFIPIEPLRRTDAEILLLFLSGNGVLYLEPPADDWYGRAVTASNITFLLGSPDGVRRVYHSSEPASPLGCIQQYQFCNPALQGRGSCGPLASLRDAIAGAASRFESSYDEVKNNTGGTPTAERFLYTVDQFFYDSGDIVGVLAYLGPTSLRSQQNMLSGVQGPLASKQWHADVSNWFNITLAMAQIRMIETASGPSDPAVMEYHMNFTTPDMQKLCNNQKIRSSDYASLSVFGLCFTLIVGLLITIASYLLESVSGFFHKNRKGYNHYAHLEWTSNATLQLQRLAHEGIGRGAWSKCDDGIPATEADELLGCLDITNLEHPILVGPPQSSKEEDNVSNDSQPTLSDPTPEEEKTEEGNMEATGCGYHFNHRPAETPRCSRESRR